MVEVVILKHLGVQIQISFFVASSSMHYPLRDSFKMHVPATTRAFCDVRHGVNNTVHVPYALVNYKGFPTDFC